MSISENEVNKLNSVDFDLSFTPDSGDNSPPDVDSMIKGMDSTQGGVKGVAPIDHAKALEGFWSFIDLIMQVVAKSTKGTIEYEKMDHATINALSQQSAQSEHFQKLAVMENAPTWLVCANAIGQFGTRIKYNPKKEEKKETKKQGLSNEDLKLIVKMMKEQKKPLQKVNTELATQGDLVKLLDSPDLSEDDRTSLKNLVENGELDEKTYTQNRIFSKSRSQVIDEEEAKARKRAEKTGVGYAN